MNEKWVEILVSVGIAVGAIASAAIFLAGCMAMVLAAWKML